MKPGLMDCPVCRGQGLAYDYHRGEWGTEKCKACGGTGCFDPSDNRAEIKRSAEESGHTDTHKKEAAMPAKGSIITPWTPEEVDHLVSFGVQVHCEKYPHRTPKAAGLRLLKERGRLGTRQPIKAGNVLIGTVERPIVTVLPSADCPGENNAIAPPERPVNTEHGLVTPEPVPLVRIGLPISLSILGPMLQVIGDSTSGATVRQVGSELWIEAPQ